jgi:two-component system LytT family response regulator
LVDTIQKLQGIAFKDEEVDVFKKENRNILSESDQVFVKDGEKCWFVTLAEIRLFESVGNYARVFFANNKPLILKSLNSLEERLDAKTFFRANRKHIVNLKMIEKVEPFFNGGLLLEIKGGEKIEVSRRQAVRFKEMMSL